MTTTLDTTMNSLIESGYRLSTIEVSGKNAIVAITKHGQGFVLDANNLQIVLGTVSVELFDDTKVALTESMPFHWNSFHLANDGVQFRLDGKDVRVSYVGEHEGVDSFQVLDCVYEESQMWVLYGQGRLTAHRK